jgi:hypothetical protein
MSLNMFCITRLKSSWKYVSRALRTSFENLSTSLKPLSNFAGYREMLAHSHGPCVPYLAVLTKDLVNLHELPTRAESNPSHLNWHKLSTMARVLRQFFKFQPQCYQFDREPEILNELFHLNAQDLIQQDDWLSVSLTVEADGDATASANFADKKRISSAEDVPTLSQSGMI